MSNNFQQFNPGSVNQETDAAYTADATRTGGITFNQILSSLLGNKMFYQWSTFIKAFANALDTKGISTSDTSLATLQTQLGNILTTKDVTPPLIDATEYTNPANTSVNTLTTLVVQPNNLGVNSAIRITALFKITTQGNLGSVFQWSDSTGTGLGGSQAFNTPNSALSGQVLKIIALITQRSSGNGGIELTTIYGPNASAAAISLSQGGSGGINLSAGGTLSFQIRAGHSTDALFLETAIVEFLP